uniref:Uncharacterized protein n=1 Tax=uncultured prokaryote TaxID=198431 RepID=A0A0H5PZ61_9ZZZZ|nr:hypothetical protein [uncultured prokaryote]
MVEIPVGYGQISWLFRGPCTPLGAAVTLGFQNVGDKAPSVIGASAAASFNSELGPIFSNQLDGEGVLVKLGPTATGPSATSSIGFGGTATGVAGPPSVSLLVHKVTELGGRAGRGRNYWPGFFEQEVDEGGNINSTAMPGLQTAFDDFFVLLESNEIAPVLLHGPNAPISSPTPLVGFDVDGRVGTQRRRLRR